MERLGIVIVLAMGLAAGHVLAAVPEYVANGGNKAAHDMRSAESSPVLAQASEPGLEAQEQQLLNQIEADSAKLKADEAAEPTQKTPVNPQRKWIRAAVTHLNDAVIVLHRTTNHYSGHKGLALKALAEAHNQLMLCYKIDSQ